LGLERPSDHKSRILTTNAFFKTFEPKGVVNRKVVVKNVEDAMNKYNRAL
jgi:hypothetical protein